VLEKLVHGYPSHDYVIDHQELQELGFTISLFGDDEKHAADQLWEALPLKKAYIECILPKPKEKPPVEGEKKIT
jgi:hypothetical protein